MFHCRDVAYISKDVAYVSRDVAYVSRNVAYVSRNVACNVSTINATVLPPATAAAAFSFSLKPTA